MTDYQAIRERTSTVELAQRYGLKVRRAGAIHSANCPFHHDGSPSFMIYADHYHCYGCGWDGTVLDFVAQLENVSIQEAAQRLDNANYVSTYKPKPLPPEKPPRPLTQADVDRDRVHVRAALSYYHKRGLSDEVIDRYLLGLRKPFPWHVNGRRMNWQRFAVPNVYNGQVRQLIFRRDDEWTMHQLAISPMYDTVVDWIAAEIGREPNTAEILEYAAGPRYISYGSPRIFALDQLLPTPTQIYRLPYIFIIPEGKPLDVLLMVSLGFPTTGVMITSSIKPHLNHLYKEVPLRFILRDNDEPGLKKAGELTAIINGGMTIAPPKQYKDFGEMYQDLAKHEKDPVKAMVDWFYQAVRIKPHKPHETRDFDPFPSNR